MTAADKARLDEVWMTRDQSLHVRIRPTAYKVEESVGVSVVFLTPRGEASISYVDQVGLSVLSSLLEKRKNRTVQLNCNPDEGEKFEEYRVQCDCTLKMDKDKYRGQLTLLSGGLTVEFGLLADDMKSLSERLDECSEIWIRRHDTDKE